MGRKTDREGGVADDFSNEPGVLGQRKRGVKKKEGFLKGQEARYEDGSPFSGQGR